MGHPEGVSLILKCDSEPAIQQVRDALGRYIGGTITPKGPPAGESQANGRVEEAGKTVREMMKVYKCRLEAGVDVLDDKSIIMQWMARWAAMAYNRYADISITKRARKLYLVSF